MKRVLHPTQLFRYQLQDRYLELRISCLGYVGGIFLCDEGRQVQCHSQVQRSLLQMRCPQILGDAYKITLNNNYALLTFTMFYCQLSWGYITKLTLCIRELSKRRDRIVAFINRVIVFFTTLVKTARKGVKVL